MTKTIKDVAIVYFSATHVTRSYARVMRDQLSTLGVDAKCFDVTAYMAREKALPIADFDALIFGFPVFADFAPSVMNAWLQTLQGKEKPCAMFFTYGARSVGYAHFHTRLLLEQAGFKLLLSGEFLGRHTFNIAGWRVIPNRPDEADFTVARRFVDLAMDKFAQDPPAPLVLQKPSGYQRALDALQQVQPATERGWTNPVRVKASCGMCRLCEEECPTQAFDAESGLSDPALCINCMHCVYLCPEKALAIDPRMEGAYQGFLERWCLTEAMMEAKQNRIISESWQTAV